MFAAVGCGRGGPSASATDEQANVSPENVPTYALASKRLATVRSALATGKDPSMKCKSLVAAVDASFRRLCRA